MGELSLLKEEHNTRQELLKSQDFSQKLLLEFRVLLLHQIFGILAPVSRAHNILQINTNRGTAMQSHIAASASHL